MRFHHLLLVILVTITVFDVGMRLDQRVLCQRSDAVRCPAAPSLWLEPFQ